MRSISQIRTYLLVVLFLSASAFSQQAEQKFVSHTEADFQYTTLQVPGSSNTWATGVNNNGDIIGYYTSGGVTQGFLFTNGEFQTISPCPDAGAEPMGINDEGVIVGTCNDGAFIYQNGNVTFLEYPKAKYTFLNAINNQGVMVGVWEKGRSTRSFVYSNGTFSTVDGMRLPGGINNSNTVSGTDCNSETCQGAIYFQGENGWKSHKKVKYPGASGTSLGGILTTARSSGIPSSHRTLFTTLTRRPSPGSKLETAFRLRLKGSITRVKSSVRITMAPPLTVSTANLASSSRIGLSR